MQSFSSFPSSISKNMQQVNTDYNPNIIKPPSRDVTHGSIARHLLIDSRERNVQTYIALKFNKNSRTLHQLN